MVTDRQSRTVRTPLWPTILRKNISARVSVLTSTPEEVVQRRLMERAWIRRLSSEGSPWTLINRDAGIDVEPLD